MTETYMKEWLQTFQALSARADAWQYCLSVDDNSEIKLNCEKLMLQIKIIGRCISVLNEKEKFMIENHLIYQKTWDETYILFEEKWGKINGRSIRTMKRMQCKAIQKMLDFLQDSKLDIYFI